MDGVDGMRQRPGPIAMQRYGRPRGNQIVRGRHLMHATKSRLLAHARPKAHRLNDRRRIDLRRDQVRGEQRLGLRCKTEISRIVEPEQRTDADAVARQNQALRPAVPNRDCELTIEARKKIETVMKISGKQKIDLSLALKRNAFSTEFGEQCPVVED